MNSPNDGVHQTYKESLEKIDQHEFDNQTNTEQQEDIIEIPIKLEEINYSLTKTEDKLEINESILNMNSSRHESITKTIKAKAIRSETLQPNSKKVGQNKEDVISEIPTVETKRKVVRKKKRVYHGQHKSSRKRRNYTTHSISNPNIHASTFEMDSDTKIKRKYRKNHTVRVNKSYYNLHSSSSVQVLTTEELISLIEEEDEEIEVIYQFNKNPKKNISILCQYYKKEETPENIAFLLMNVPGLLRKKIGEFLAIKGNEPILNAYFMNLDLKTNFITAMRTALGGPLHLPGEAQEIDRIMQVFSTCYINQNPKVFQNSEVAYILSFALIMLNSDLHNPNVQRKMTCSEFIVNIKGSLNDHEISDKMLMQMYEELKSNPFQFSGSSNEFLAMSAPKLRGYLEIKYEKMFSKWKKHYFVLTNSCLYYFKDNSGLSDDSPQGMIQLTEVDVFCGKNPTEIVIKTTSNQIQFVKFQKKMPVIKSGIKKICFRVQDQNARDKWMMRLIKSKIMSNFQVEKPEACLDFQNESMSDL